MSSTLITRVLPQYQGGFYNFFGRIGGEMKGFLREPSSAKKALKKES
jgi:hypothetical protein